MSSYGNIHFIGLARLVSGKGVILASHSYNTKIDLNGVKQVIEQPNICMQQSKFYSFSVGSQSWHLVADTISTSNDEKPESRLILDQSELIYIVISKLNYPQRCAHMCLDECQKQFTSKVNDKSKLSTEKSCEKVCGNMLLKLCQKYDNVAEVDKIASVNMKVESVKVIMQENIDIALQNCVKVESIEKATEDLQHQANIFKKKTKELKQNLWLKSMRMRMIISSIVLVLAGIIVAAILL